ncbi:MAG: ABC transporter ATP-binding protein [Clostridiaceae bacterium]|nr:ABC transporter ATP-binding protein [Clostridiaceae bacterium]
MKSKKTESNWLKILFSFASYCKGKMIISMICSIISVAGSFIPYICLYKIIEQFIFNKVNTNSFISLCIYAALGYLVQMVFFEISTLLSHSSAYEILNKLRLKIANTLMKASLGDVTSKDIGYLKNIMINKVEGIERPLAHMIPELGGSILLVVLIFGYLFSIDYRIGLASLVTIPIAAIPMIFSMRTFNKKYNAYMKANDYVNSVIVEYVEGIEVIKMFNQSSSSYEKFSNAISSFKEFTLDWFKSTWKSLNLTFAILPTTFLGVLPIGLILYKLGELTPVNLCMCLILALSLIKPLAKTTAFINEIKSMQYDVKGTEELLNIQTLKDSKKKVNLNNFDINLENISFSYTGKKDEEVIHNMSLKLLEKSFTALVGPSGGGKSTIAKLIARFWDVTEGKIKIGNVDIKDIPLKQLSDTISFVTQDNFLFNCSIKENIRLGNPNATDEEVYRAAKQACCEEFIMKLQDGYDTTAGDAGKSLSGGEKQRIAIARCILKNAPIVILDEATAFTDPQNEDKIQKSIAELTKGKTLLVIAHRLSTIQSADQIIVLEKGQIADKGTQEELLENSPLYKRMWQAHIGARNWSVSENKKGVVLDV